jgi:predicted nuclease of predicted toxin-antitoxin system
VSPIIEPVLQLILDQGVPADATQGFRNLGYSCWHVAELGMHKAEDEEILALAAERNAVVITLDADFHALAAIRGLRLHP